MFGTENRESTHDDGPRNESVRDSIDRAVGEVRFRDISHRAKEKNSEFKARQKTDPHAGFGPADRQAFERLERQEATRGAVRENTTKPQLQQSLNAGRRDLALKQALGEDRAKELAERSKRDADRTLKGDSWNNPKADPVKHMSVRESIAAAIAETKLPEQVVTDVDPIAGSVKTDIARDPQDAFHPPMHWEGVHKNEFLTLPDEVRRGAHKHTQAVTTFNGWRLALGDPKRSFAAFSDIFTRNPLNEQQKQEFANWARDPNRSTPQRPQFQFTLPTGWTHAAWMQASPAVRAAVRKEAEMVFMATEADGMIADPNRRLEAAKILYDTFVPIQQAFGQAMAQTPQGQVHVAAEQTVTTWARTKPHYNAQLPDGQGGTVSVKWLMGAALAKGLVKPSQGDPYGLNAAYNLIVNAAQQEGHLTARALRAQPQRKTSTSMRGGAPSPAPQGPAPKNDGSVRSAIKAALQGIAFS